MGQKERKKQIEKNILLPKEEFYTNIEIIDYGWIADHVSNLKKN